MNYTFTDFHKKRYEWAFRAKREFMNRFVRFDVQKVDLDKEELSFRHLLKCSSEAEKTSKREFAECEKNIETLETLIKRKRLQIDQEGEVCNIQLEQISLEIENYQVFTSQIEKKIQDMKAMEIEPFVKKCIIYDTNHKKASILNEHASRLEATIAKSLDKQFTKIKEEAQSLKIASVHELKRPELDSIPKIQQKIDNFWLTSSYDKAFYKLCDKAVDWVVEMYNAYLYVLTSILNRATEKYEQLRKRAQDLTEMKDEKIKRLHKEMIEDEKKRDQLLAYYDEVSEMWKQDCEHAKQLQGYFMKHWFLYKDELQQRFLSSNVEERWFVSQYLQILQQDGEKIIESLNR
jgi:hypothetical protein